MSTKLNEANAKQLGLIAGKPKGFNRILRLRLAGHNDYKQVHDLIWEKIRTNVDSRKYVNGHKRANSFKSKRFNFNKAWASVEEYLKNER